MDGECLECGQVGNWCKCDGEIADNTDELIEAMKEGFAVRLADVEARAEAVKNDFATRLADAEDKAEKYRLALAECRLIMENQHLFRTHGDVQLRLRKTITEALE